MGVLYLTAVGDIDVGPVLEIRLMMTFRPVLSREIREMVAKIQGLFSFLLYTKEPARHDYPKNGAFEQTISSRKWA